MKITSIIISAQDAKDLHNALLMGINAIGSLMFWAANSGEYSNEQAKRDMGYLGELLEYLPLIARELIQECEE